MNSQLRSLIYLNAIYWIVLGIFEGIGFFPGVTMKVARSMDIHEWDPIVIRQYWQYVIHSTIPKYASLLLLGMAVVLFFLRIKAHKGIRLFLLLFAGSIIHAILQSLLSKWLGTTSGLGLPQLIAAKANVFILTISVLNISISYWLFIVALFAFDYFHRFREEQITNLELSNTLSQSRLESLVYQLRPHFLFNTMNAISMLVRGNENKKAVEVIADLSELLRHSLNDEKRALVPLGEEIELMKKYLDLEEKLYNESLEVDISIEPRAKPVLVPHLILQPIIENAFKHGLSHVTSKGFLKISAKVESQRLVIQITNSGPSLDQPWDWRTNKGIGLSNVATRLKNQYYGDFQLNMGNVEFGVVVSISIPVQQ
ncbi:MAG: histidine kinase [Cyclobacteriaceae bacterium]